jgi:Rap1a immunity proteins
MTFVGASVDTFITGEDLLKDLKIADDDEACWAARSHALGYISGLIDAHQIFQQVERFPAVFTFPTLSAGELNDLIAGELEREPDVLDANAAGLVFRILQEKFPPAQPETKE